MSDLWRKMVFFGAIRSCRQAFIDAGIDPDASHNTKPTSDRPWAWHVHHAVLAEKLYDSVQDRIDWIIATKPFWEVRTRLLLFRPIHTPILPSIISMFDYVTFRVDIDTYDFFAAAHFKEHPNCPWDGTSIFPEPSNSHLNRS